MTVTGDTEKHLCFVVNRVTKVTIPANLQQYTVMVLRFWTDMPGQTVQTQIRLLLEETVRSGFTLFAILSASLDSLLYGRAT